MLKHKYFTAIFTLCLAVTITMIPVRASEVPQGEATEAVAAAQAGEVTASAGDEITSKDHEERPESKDPESKESGAEAAQSEDSTDSVNEQEGTEQEKVTPAEINVAAGTATVAMGDTLKKQSAASSKIKQMKLEVIDYKDNGYGDSQMLTSGGKRLLIDTYVKESWGTLNNWLKDHGYFNI